MAKDKKSVLLYCDLIHTVEKMDDEIAGKFFKHYLRYINDLNPKTDNLVVDLTFEGVKQNLKRDLKKWESTLEAKKLSGQEGNLKRWHLDVYNKYKAGELTLEESQRIAKHRKAIKEVANVAVTDTVTVTDNVTVTDKDIKASTSIPTLEEFIKHAKDRKPNVNPEDVRLRYFAWVDNDWSITRKGEKEPIKNWKSSLTNTVKYLSEVYVHKQKKLTELEEWELEQQRLAKIKSEQ